MTSSLGIAVIGGGSFGTVVANIIAENGYEVSLWLRSEAQAQDILSTRINHRYMPDYPLLPEVMPTNDLEKAVSGAKVIIMAVPSKAFRQVLKQVKAYLADDAMVVSTTKGIEATSNSLMSQVMRQELPTQAIGVLSGPNLAKEIAKRQLAATVIASDDAEVRSIIQAILRRSYFRVYANNDMYGVELGGALKNIYAIATGMAAALGMGENTKSMLVTRSLAEMSRFAVRLGANPLTFIGLAGVGDLMVTCMSPLSRNYRVGFALGQGGSLEKIVEELGEVAEGVGTLECLHHWSKELDVYMPLVDGLYAVVFDGRSVEEVIKALMGGEQSSDVEFVLPRGA
ncbi:NAD(P)H-dependent glycerol-3-phosphate dehydrogenase [Pokkaliibacter sp. CJK22405]|uniref:NAD(P)H-dependent glycerol-3-phosphate dehydrogenase n=1 Tax=Pokkaliibacter sp. CJK22405 TaxID=3384615 RepID=UPI0039846F59